MQKTLKKTSEFTYLFGMILCALGVTLSANSGFGVSMVVAPAFVVYRKLSEVFPGFTFGLSEYILQGAIIVLTALVCRRFKWKYVLSFATVLVYGAMVDFWRWLLGSEVYSDMTLRIFCAVAGAVTVAFSIAALLRTYLPQQAYELCVQEFAERFSLPLSRVKWVYDLTSLAVAVVLMLLMFGRFDFGMIGIGTLVLTCVNAPLIGFFGKLLDRVSDFSPAFVPFWKFFQKHFD